MSGIKLDKKDWFGKSDPYLIFYKSLSPGQWKEVHRTEVIKNTLDPNWAPFELSEQELCNGDSHCPIKIECYDWDSDSSSDFIGVCETTINQLETTGFKFELTNPHDKNKHSGTLELTDCKRHKVLTFIDYLRCGLQISLSVAIDFTLSNGKYSEPQSLHFLDTNNLNQYERTIKAVGGMLSEYGRDRNVQVFGFGGVPHGQHKASHCFALTQDESNPCVAGIEEVLNLYRASHSNITLSGPTHFQPLIDRAISHASTISPYTNHHILLIIADGPMADVADTVRSVVRASSLPLSIIIVGVGNAEFAMAELVDCEGKVLVDDSGKAAARDTAQFALYRQFEDNIAALAADALKEVPHQIIEFMKAINYLPEIPEVRPIWTIMPEEENPRLEQHLVIEKRAEECVDGDKIARIEALEEGP